MEGSGYESGPKSAQEEESRTGSGEEDGTVHDWRTSPTNDQWLGDQSHDKSGTESGSESSAAT